MKAQLTGQLKELHLPAMRAGFEELARQAQQESAEPRERQAPSAAGGPNSSGAAPNDRK